MISSGQFNAVPLTLGGRVLVFSDALQKVFELNASAHALWQALASERVPTPAFSSSLFPLDTVENQKIIEQLQSLGLLSLDEDTAPAPSEDGHSVAHAAARDNWVAGRSAPHLQRFSIGGTSVEIIYDTAESERLCSGLWSHLPEHGGAFSATIMVQISTRPDGINVRINEEIPVSYSQAEAAAGLKGLVTGAVLAVAKYDVALHAAALVRGGHATLLCGEPGAGKTTLSIALSAHGFDLAGDDIALLRSGGGVTPLAFPAALKSGAWDLCTPFVPEIAAIPEHLRPDGQRVKYCKASVFSDEKPLPVSRIIFLTRCGRSPPTLSIIDPVEALEGLLADAFAPRERLTQAGFAALVSLLNNARCLRLRYSDVGEAAALLAAQ